MQSDVVYRNGAWYTSWSSHRASACWAYVPFALWDSWGLRKKWETLTNLLFSTWSKHSADGLQKSFSPLILALLADLRKEGESAFSAIFTVGSALFSCTEWLCSALCFQLQAAPHKISMLSKEILVWFWSGKVWLQMCWRKTSWDTGWSGFRIM